MKMVIHLHAEVSVTDKQLREAFFEYKSSNYYYILLSYNTGWDEKQVIFPRLITILYHETHHHLYPREKNSSPSLSQRESPPPIITFKKKNSVGLQLLNNHCCFFSIYQQSCYGCGFFCWCCAGHAITWDDLTHMLLYYVFYVSLSYHIQQW